MMAHWFRARSDDRCTGHHPARRSQWSAHRPAYTPDRSDHTRESDVVALCFGFVLTRFVFTTFHPCASGRTSGNCGNTGMEHAIARRLNVLKQHRRDDPVGFVPVGEVNHLRVVDADLFCWYRRSIHDASSSISSVSSSSGEFIGVPPAPTARLAPGNMIPDVSHLQIPRSGRRDSVNKPYVRQYRR
jgi:hypothetical protein